MSPISFPKNYIIVRFDSLDVDANTQRARTVNIDEEGMKGKETIGVSFDLEIEGCLLSQNTGGNSSALGDGL